ncbi:MAG: hypothetical protein HYR88_03765 [Verrucomicrobia bacterium]|nr:hypothetical protein [Verrucomicrobiota bacterium]MBI3869708.1 hypothetical protein [Verrucomicrobiota bacterium]
MSAFEPLVLEMERPRLEETLALEEALLEACDAGEVPAVLGFWEPRSLAVVVGYANSAKREANLEACDADGVPVLRRCSGGGTVLQMPGVLNYTLVGPIPESGDLSTLSGTNVWMMRRLAHALERLPGLGGRVSTRGITDICLDDRKCVGNAQRRKRAALLFHGSVLLSAPLPMMESYLAFPSQSPDYRAHRSHTEFCVNLGIASDLARAALVESWGGRAGEVPLPLVRMRRLMDERYGRQEWHRRT